jgi:hypothetical protein
MQPLDTYAGQIAYIQGNLLFLGNLVQLGVKKLPLLITFELSRGKKCQIERNADKKPSNF